MRPFTLNDFVRESNRIEGITREPTENEVVAHARFLELSDVLIGHVQEFVRRVADAPIRSRPGMDVSVGQHRPMPGGPEVIQALVELLSGVRREPLIAAPWSVPHCFELHRRYESLHPFMDGNGRSGRALWLWMMGGVERAPLGFLHHWYYQSLAAVARPERGAEE